MSHNGCHHIYSLSIVMGKIKSHRVRWVGHAAHIKVKIIHNFGRKISKKKSHPKDVSVESRWKENI